MAGVALLARVSPSVASTADVGGGRREMALMSSNARAEYAGDFSHHLKRQSVSQLSCCTSNYIQLRGREKRVLQLTMSSSQHVLNGSSARLAVAHAGSLSERIASSQFCSCSSSSSDSGGVGGSSSPGLHNRKVVEGLLRHWFLSKSSKVTTRRRVVAAAISADGLKQIHLSGSQLGSCWTRKRTESVPPVAAGPGQPLSENWDVGDFRMDTSFGMDDGGDVSLGDASLGDASLVDALPGGASTDEDLKFTDLVATRIVDGTNGASSQVSHNEDKQEVDSIASESPSSSSEGGWISKRWAIVILCFFAFLLCNMDRVNMSIAILPMSAEYHWNPTTVGLVQSSFFWGYLLTQVAGGVWADSIGGKQVLGFGVIWWSLATIATPIAAKIGLPALFFVRACMGIGEGVAMPAMNNLLSKWIPVGERSRSLALVYSGMYLGSVIGLGVSPTLIHKLGWPSVFFCFGSMGAIWFAVWQQFAYSSPAEDPTLSNAERELILKTNKPNKGITRIPWGLILSKAPVWALIICHFCHNWGTFILLTWMPTYYHQVLGFNLTESGLFSVLPWLTMAISANVGGWIADTLVSKGYSITLVRKVMQSIGFLGPAFFLTQLSHITSPPLAVLCMMASQGSDAFSQAGLYSNHQDIGPRYSGILLGLSNTAGVLAGVFGTAATGYILQHGSWDDVFKVAVGLYLFGTVIWNVFSTGEQLFD